MKLFAFLALLAGGSAARFEAEGIRVGGTLVQGRAMELKGTILVSGTSVEPLSEALEIELSPGRLLTVEPGLRVVRVEQGCRVQSPAGRKIRFEAGDRALLLDGPVAVVAEDGAWTVGAERIESPSLRAALQAQDDADANLQRMRQSSQRMKEAAKSGRMVRVFGNADPLAGAEGADSHTVRVLGQLSPAGF